jgi:hypothetical protein
VGEQIGGFMDRKYVIRIKEETALRDELHFTNQSSFSFAASEAYNLCFDKMKTTGKNWRIIEVIESFNSNKK